MKVVWWSEDKVSLSDIQSLFPWDPSCPPARSPLRCLAKDNAKLCNCAGAFKCTNNWESVLAKAHTPQHFLPDLLCWGRGILQHELFATCDEKNTKISKEKSFVQTKRSRIQPSMRHWVFCGQATHTSLDWTETPDKLTTFGGRQIGTSTPSVREHKSSRCHWKIETLLQPSEKKTQITHNLCLVTNHKSSGLTWRDWLQCRCLMVHIIGVQMSGAEWMDNNLITLLLHWALRCISCQWNMTRVSAKGLAVLTTSRSVFLPVMIWGGFSGVRFVQVIPGSRRIWNRCCSSDENCSKAVFLFHTLENSEDKSKFEKQPHHIGAQHVNRVRKVVYFFGDRRTQGSRVTLVLQADSGWQRTEAFSFQHYNTTKRKHSEMTHRPGKENLHQLSNNLHCNQCTQSLGKICTLKPSPNKNVNFCTAPKSNFIGVLPPRMSVSGHNCFHQKLFKDLTSVVHSTHSGLTDTYIWSPPSTFSKFKQVAQVPTAHPNWSTAAVSGYVEGHPYRCHLTSHFLMSGGGCQNSQAKKRQTTNCAFGECEWIAVASRTSLSCEWKIRTSDLTTEKIRWNELFPHSLLRTCFLPDTCVLLAYVFVVRRLRKLVHTYAQQWCGEADRRNCFRIRREISESSSHTFPFWWTLRASVLSCLLFDLAFNQTNTTELWRAECNCRSKAENSRPDSRNNKTMSWDGTVPNRCVEHASVYRVSYLFLSRHLFSHKFGHPVPVFVNKQTHKFLRVFFTSRWHHNFTTHTRNWNKSALIHFPWNFPNLGSSLGRKSTLRNRVNHTIKNLHPLPKFPSPRKLIKRNDCTENRKKHSTSNVSQNVAPLMSAATLNPQYLETRVGDQVFSIFGIVSVQNWSLRGLKCERTRLEALDVMCMYSRSVSLNEGQEGRPEQLGILKVKCSVQRKTSKWPLPNANERARHVDLYQRFEHFKQIGSLINRTFTPIYFLLRW